MPAAMTVDQRLPYLNVSNLRNDLKIFPFNPNASAFGSGQASIVDVSLIDEAGHPYSWVVGGENVALLIKAELKAALDCPIFGFFVKNKMGQALFGDNTYLTYLDAPLSAPAGAGLEASFHFQMPRLPPGGYSICVALAEGTQYAYITHQWIHNALIFEARSSSVDGVLVGLPMQKISLSITSGTAEK
jgi:lipopolysaccharide transport system ATP-binding protein